MRSKNVGFKVVETKVESERIQKCKNMNNYSLERAVFGV